MAGIAAELVLPEWATRITMGNRGRYDIAVNGTTNESNDPKGISGYMATNLPRQLHAGIRAVAAEAGRAAGGRTSHLRQGRRMNTRHAVPWAGLRPMMPDTMPRVMQGRNPRVFYNTGRGYLGWTLSAATADAVASLATARTNA